MSTRPVEIQLQLGLGARYHVVSCQITEGISRLTHAQIEIASLDDIDFEPLVASDASLTVAVGGAPLRKWSLKLGRASFVAVKDGTLRYTLELFPHLWLLSHTRSTRKFRNLSAQDIVSQVLAELGVAFQWQTTRTTPVRKYCTQYRESTLAFVLRLLESEGIYYTFDPQDVLIFADRSSASDLVEGNARYSLLDATSALDRDELGIHEVQKRAHVASGKVTVNDYTWKRPKLDLIHTSTADTDTDLEVYHYPAGYRNPAQGVFLSQIHLESHRVAARQLLGRGNVPSFAPAKCFTFDDSAGLVFAGEFVLIEVTHLAHNMVYADVTTLPKGRVYENRFVAIPRNVPFRSAFQTPRPTVAGFHTAMVRGPVGEEIHTDKYGRFRAQFHWDREAQSTDADSRWLRMLQETASSMTLARVGWEVSVGYIDGDPDRPIGICRDINGVMTPTYAQPANKNVMTIKTPSTPTTGGFNEVRLDDSAGKMNFYVRAERDLVTLVRHDRTERIGNNETHLVRKQLNRTIYHDQDVTIGANSLTSTGQEYRLNVKKDRNKTVLGNETFEVGTDISVSILSNDVETVGATRQTEAGLESQGSIDRRTVEDLSRSVGGAFVATGTGNIQLLVKGNLTETVGGMKLAVAQKGGITQTVSGMLTVNVSGSVTRISGSDMGISTERSTVTIAGPATFNSPERFEIWGDTILLEAASNLTLAAPGIEISLSPAAIRMKGKIRYETASNLSVTGNPDNLTK